MFEIALKISFQKLRLSLEMYTIFMAKFIAYCYDENKFLRYCKGFIYFNKKAIIGLYNLKSRDSLFQERD
jgi:hypothetical protein